MEILKRKTLVSHRSYPYKNCIVNEIAKVKCKCGFTMYYQVIKKPLIYWKQEEGE